MNKLMLTLIASVFASAVAAQTGTVTPRTIADHGTPAMHAEESAKNVNVSKQVQGLTDTKSRQQAVKDTTKIADHGTPVIHADEASKNVVASKNGKKPLGTSKAAQDAVQTATKGQTK